MVFLQPEGSETACANIKEELSKFSNTKIGIPPYGSPSEIQEFHHPSLKTDLLLDADLASKHVFIIDKELK